MYGIKPVMRWVVCITGQLVWSPATENEHPTQFCFCLCPHQNYNEDNVEGTPLSINTLA